ncbi:hypothetical protein CDIK_1737 [Cucumispora dikerogammari]|nr:hypothetical protein CDIK_1737 [Cucumispora dikerogammari]
MTTDSIKKLVQIDTEMKELLKTAQIERTEALQSAKHEATNIYKCIKENYKTELQNFQTQTDLELIEIEKEIKENYEKTVKNLELKLKIDLVELETSKFNNKEVLQLIDDLIKNVANQ